jgi:hypothetical protein
MAYNINVTGNKADVLAALRSQAAAQRTTQTSAYEQGLLDKAVTDAEEKVNQFAGDDDSIAVSINGNFSQADRALGVNSTCGVSISKAAAATPQSGPSAGTTAPAGAVASAPTAAGAPVTSGAPGTPAAGTR